MDVLRHIPQILFEGYQPAAFDPEVQKKFGIWVLTECLLAVFLLPNGRKRRKWEKDDDAVSYTHLTLPTNSLV